jgi:hypothetical protein
MKYFWEICAFLFLLFIIIERQACHPCKDKTVTKIQRDTVWKYVPLKSIQYVTLYDTVYITKYIWRLKPYQKDSIIKEHLTPALVNREFEDDTIKIFISDTIYQNKIKDEVLAYKLKIPFTTIIPPKKPRNKIFIGLGAVGNNNQLFISPEAMLLTKKENYLKLGYDPVNRAAGFSFGFKIGKHE